MNVRRSEQRLRLPARSWFLGRLAFYTAGLALIGSGCLVTGSGAPVQSIQTAQSIQTVPIFVQGHSERVVLNPERNPTLSVWRGSRRVWEGIPQRWRPWKVATANVDGSRFPEIVVGIRKRTRFFPTLHNCLFLYTWNGVQASPKWLGSALSRPYTDFAFGPLDGPGHDRLVAVEILPKDRLGIVAYAWNGFGFTGEWQRGAWRSARVIAVRKGRVELIADGKRITVHAPR